MRHLLFWLLLAPALGCAGELPRHVRDEHAAERAYVAGRYTEAAALYQQAAAHAATAHDRDEELYRAAASFERGEKLQDADGAYARVVDGNGERAARSLLARADIAQKQNDGEKAQSLRSETMRRFPNSGPAVSAAHEYLRQ